MFGSSPPTSCRQHRRAHQRLVDRARGLAAFADRPDDQRLAAAHVAGRIEPVDPGPVVAVVGGDIGRAAAVDVELSLPSSSLRRRR